MIEVIAEGVPAGLGAPVYAKLDAELASALMGINAVKGVEIGDGFATAAMRGEDNADEMRIGNDRKPVFLSNHAGGILGGISTGQPIVARFAVKPTSSILTPRKTVDRYGNDTEIVTKGRHDPCVGIRAVPVAEAMVACVLADAYLMQRAQVGEGTAVAVRETRLTPARPTVPDSHARVEAAIKAFAKGEIVVVTDDDDRENEGDLFVAASLCTPEKMAFIIRHTSGIVCAPLGSISRAVYGSIRWWRRTMRRSAPHSRSPSTCGMGSPPASRRKSAATPCARWRTTTAARRISSGPATSFR